MADEPAVAASAGEEVTTAAAAGAASAVAATAGSAATATSSYVPGLPAAAAVVKLAAAASGLDAAAGSSASAAAPVSAHPAQIGATSATGDPMNIVDEAHSTASMYLAAPHLPVQGPAAASYGGNDSGSGGGDRGDSSSRYQRLSLVMGAEAPDDAAAATDSAANGSAASGVAAAAANSTAAAAPEGAAARADSDRAEGGNSSGRGGRGGGRGGRGSGRGGGGRRKAGKGGGESDSSAADEEWKRYKYAFNDFIWKELESLHGWTVTTGNRPGDHYWLPKGVIRGMGAKPRVDFFDSIKLVINHVLARPNVFGDLMERALVVAQANPRNPRNRPRPSRPSQLGKNRAGQGIPGLAPLPNQYPPKSSRVGEGFQAAIWGIGVFGAGADAVPGAATVPVLCSDAANKKVEEEEYAAMAAAAAAVPEGLRWTGKTARRLRLQPDAGDGDEALKRRRGGLIWRPPPPGKLPTGWEKDFEPPPLPPPRLVTDVGNDWGSQNGGTRSASPLANGVGPHGVAAKTDTSGGAAPMDVVASVEDAAAPMEVVASVEDAAVQITAADAAKTAAGRTAAVAGAETAIPAADGGASVMVVEGAVGPAAGTGAAPAAAKGAPAASMEPAAASADSAAALVATAQEAATSTGLKEPIEGAAPARAAPAVPIDFRLETLMKQDYDAAAAAAAVDAALKDGSAPVSRPWESGEELEFQILLYNCYKDFAAMQEGLESRSRAEVADYYYRTWKPTARRHPYDGTPKSYSWFKGNWQAEKLVRMLYSGVEEAYPTDAICHLCQQDTGEQVLLCDYKEIGEEDCCNRACHVSCAGLDTNALPDEFFCTTCKAKEGGGNSDEEAAAAPPRKKRRRAEAGDGGASGVSGGRRLAAATAAAVTSRLSGPGTGTGKRKAGRPAAESSRPAADPSRPGRMTRNSNGGHISGVDDAGNGDASGLKNGGGCSSSSSHAGELALQRETLTEELVAAAAGRAYFDAKASGSATGKGMAQLSDSAAVVSARGATAANGGESSSIVK